MVILFKNDSSTSRLKVPTFQGSMNDEISLFSAETGDGKNVDFRSFSIRPIRPEGITGKRVTFVRMQRVAKNKSPSTVP